MNNYPRAFSHIGISVTDVAKAVKFYSEVMGWYLIMKPNECQSDSTIRVKSHTGWFTWKTHLDSYLNFTHTVTSLLILREHIN